MLLQSNKVFLNAMLVADRFGGASPAPVAVLVEINEGKPVSELSLSTWFYLCALKGLQIRSGLVAVAGISKNALLAATYQGKQKNWLVLLLVLLFLYKNKA